MRLARALALTARDFLALVVATLIGCAPAPNEPYLVERSAGDWQPRWIGDGPPTVLEVHNPLDVAIDVKVACPSSDPLSDGVAYWETDVPALDVVRVQIQELAKDARTATCWIESWSKRPP